MNTTTLLVRQVHLETTRIATTNDVPLADGQIRTRVDAFALTSNNMSYATFGDVMNYWRAYPSGEAGWGIVPAWGFATVVQSRHPGVAVGERLYGYWPMSNQAVLSPGDLSPAGFRDVAQHRAELHLFYNQYLRCDADPFHAAGSEDALALLRTLFVSSWLIDDFMAENDFFGATTLLLSSASSKTAYGTAFQLSQRPGVEVIGLTSPGNRAFCESLGCYSRVLTYDELEQVPADTRCVYVDFASNADLRRRIHTRFGDLKYSCPVGGTHVRQLSKPQDLPGPRPVQFFAPAQMKKRQDDWGPAELDKKLVQAWRAFSARACDAQRPWLRVEHHNGPQEVQQAYALVHAGRSDPRLGYILSLA